MIKSRLLHRRDPEQNFYHDFFVFWTVFILDLDSEPFF